MKDSPSEDAVSSAADSNPLGQIQELLDDPGRMLDKISRIRSALDSMKGILPQSAPADENRPDDESQAGFLSADGSACGRLQHALREMQTQIDERIKPLASEIVRREVARLRARSDEHQNALRECVARIDQSLLTCVARIDEYRRRAADLDALNHRLAELGGTPEPPPLCMPMGSAADTLLARFEGLRLAGKI